MKNIITCLTFFVSGFAVGYYTGGEVVRKVYRTIYKMPDEEVERCRKWLNGEEQKE
jgi:hypothetical protein